MKKNRKYHDNWLFFFGVFLDNQIAETKTNFFRIYV